MARSREAGMEDRILDSAFTIFGEKGYAAATMKDIAEGVGLSSGSLYTYFPDKEALFKAAVKRAWAYYIEELEAIKARKLPRPERMALLVEEGFDTLLEAFPIVQGIFFEATRFDLIEEDLDRVSGIIVELMDSEKDGGDGVMFTETRAARLLVTKVMILGVLANSAIMPKNSEREVLDQLRGTLGRMVQRSGLQGRSPHDVRDEKSATEK